MTFLRKLSEVKFDTPIALLTARGNFENKKNYFLNNTELHQAILDNDIKVVEKCLKKANDSMLARISLLNTPLLLALKLGNTNIAKYILAKATELDLYLNINHKDVRGLTALDWAAMLRDDDVIKMILSLPDLELTSMSYAKALYYQSVDANIFKGFIHNLKPRIADEIPEHGYPSLYIFMQEPYSDMIYFMRDICVNMQWLNEKSFPELSIATHLWFYQCFELGYETFCAERNKKPVNKELLDAMISEDALENWRTNLINPKQDALKNHA